MEIVQSIANPSNSKFSTCLQLIDEYNFTSFPYVILKDNNSVSLINTKTMGATLISSFKYKNHILHSSLLSFKTKETMRIVVIQGDENSQVSNMGIAEYEIGDKMRA